MSGRATPELLGQVDGVIREMNENFHTSIEDDFKPSLEAMLAGDLSFYADPAKASVFCRGLAAQYLRTDLVKKARRIWRESDFEFLSGLPTFSCTFTRSIWAEASRSIATDIKSFFSKTSARYRS